MSSSEHPPSSSSEPADDTSTTTATTTTTTAAVTSSPPSTFVGDSSSSSSIGLPVIPVPRRLGSISGLRTVSGSVSGLQGTGSFDDIAFATSTRTHNDHQRHPGASDVRRRANTDHAGTLLQGLSSSTNFSMSTAATNPSNQQPMTVTISDSDDSTNSTMRDNNDITTTTTSSNIADGKVTTTMERTASNDSADEEMKMAKAMALAVQSNPNLTTAEIHQLMGATIKQNNLVLQQQQQQQNNKANTASTAAAPQQQSKTASMLIPGRLSNVFHLNPTDIVESNSTNTTTTTTAPKSVKANFKTLQESFRVSGQKARERLMDIVGTKSNDDGSTTSTTPTNNGGAPAIPMARPLSPTASIDTSTTMKRSPFRASAMVGIKNMVRSPSTTATTTVVTSPSVDADNASVASGRGVSNGNGDGGTPVKSPSNAAAVTTTTTTTMTTTTTTTLPSSGDDRIRVTTIVWKRRSGLGKYSVHSAWERRRIVLQGSKLSYYTTTGSNDMDAPDSGLSLPSDLDDSGDGNGNSSNSILMAPKKANWFEQATATLVGGGNNYLIGNYGGGDDPTTPRGYLDLVKDGATVAAATGHSGAPTPFAISIKIRGETKWKLCFDMHKTQMEWLAALTDVVVQASVDAYNATLVDAMNPAHLDTPILFQTPLTVYEPPLAATAAAAAAAQRGTTGGVCGGGGGTGAATAAVVTPGGGHRLWMLENYTIKSQIQLEGSGYDDGDDEDDDDNGNETLRDDDDAELNEEDENQTATVGDAAKEDGVEEAKPEELETAAPLKDLSTFSIPEKNLVYVASVLNASLAFARASSTSMEGFWFVVVYANLALYLCTVQQIQKAKRVSRKAMKAQVVETSVVTADKGGSSEVVVVETTAEVQRTTTVKSTVVTSRPNQAQATGGGFKPIAGTTSVQIQNPTDVPMNSLNHIFAGWRAPSGDTLMVRSHGYLSTKKKIPSPGELYQLVTIDIFESPRRYPDMAPRVQLPKVHFDDGDKPKTWHSPDIFIVSFALPTDPPKMTGAAESDGGGYTVTMYFKMHDDTREILRRITCEDYDPSQEPPVKDVQKSKVNAVRLFEEWCRRAPTDPKFQSRFKLVPHAHNLKEIGMPGWISKYNGKPLLIKRPGQTGFLLPHPELSCIEFDISLHVFPFVAKKAICYMKENFFRKVLVTFGFVIEGRADDELPECVIGLMQLCYPDPIHAIQAKDFFAGKCPRSFD